MAKNKKKYTDINIKVFELLDMETQFSLIQYKKELERREARERRRENRLNRRREKENGK